MGSNLDVSVAKETGRLADEDTYLRATSERKLSLISLIHEATSLVVSMIG